MPSEKGTLIHISEVKDAFELQIINDLGFEHFLFPLQGDKPHDKSDDLCKMIKYTIDHFLSI